jgi:ribonuclease BN (tRNA processing enzyme)
VYQVTGTFIGMNRQGLNYSHEVVSPLVRYMSYRYFVSGILELEVGNRDVVIDFGNGTLDNLVDITINGTTYTNVALTH